MPHTDNVSEGQDYFAAMKCAANIALANRQVILHRVREVFSDLWHRDPVDLGLHMVYDVAHNTAKLETHEVDGEPRRLLVHFKGATPRSCDACDGSGQRVTSRCNQGIMFQQITTCPCCQGRGQIIEAPCPLSTLCSGRRWKRQRLRVLPKCRSLPELNLTPCSNRFTLRAPAS